VTRADRYPLALLGMFTVLWALLAVAPWYRQDWLLENVLVLIVVPVLALTARKLRFSNLAYTCVFVFLVLHEIGAHYTYSEVPWREGLQALGLDATRFAGRNHFDRLVHFCYGLLMLPASWELFQQRAPPRGMWRFILPVTFIMGHSVLYELIEWAAAVAFGGDLGEAYLGTQGDTWDAQKDMALASLGAVLGAAWMLARERRHEARQ
jgi:putative membrane protein